MTNSGKSATLLVRVLGMIPNQSVATSVWPKANRSSDSDHRERGDVAAWVVITLLSAVLAAALLVLSGPALGELFNQTMDPAGN